MSKKEFAEGGAVWSFGLLNMIDLGQACIDLLIK